ncbi:MAG: hypothetical protein FWH03_05165 [Firmicutes bacterium]|nr:hypothetical protein [Bacillota bacterium]
MTQTLKTKFIACIAATLMLALLLSATLSIRPASAKEICTDSSCLNIDCMLERSNQEACDHSENNCWENCRFQILTQILDEFSTKDMWHVRDYDNDYSGYWYELNPNYVQGSEEQGNYFISDTLYIGIVEDAFQRRMQQLEGKYPQQVVFVPQRYSYNFLREITYRIRTELIITEENSSRVLENIYNLTGLGVNAQTNQVRISLYDKAEDREENKALLIIKLQEMGYEESMFLFEYSGYFYFLNENRKLTPLQWAFITIGAVAVITAIGISVSFAKKHRKKKKELNINEETPTKQTLSLQ